MTVGTKKQRKQWEKTGVWSECLRVTKAQGSITELFSLFLVIKDSLMASIKSIKSRP